MYVSVTGRENNTVNLYNSLKPSDKFCIKYSIPSHSVLYNQARLISLFFIIVLAGLRNKFLLLFYTHFEIVLLKQMLR